VSDDGVLDLYVSRAFLNRPGHHSVGAIMAKVEITETMVEPDEGEPGEPHREVHMWGQLMISDCFRQVTLDLNANDHDAIDNSIFKLRRIEAEARRCRQFFEAHRTEVTFDG
jgi:hypothetical protein